MRTRSFFLTAFGLSLVLGCSGSTNPRPGGNPDRDAGTLVLRLATTTSTRDSGLLDVLLPGFERQQKCRVDVVAVGTGAALKLGQAGDADVLIVHAREAEEAFIEAGHGTRHEELMVNFFTILGPDADPGGVRGLDAPAAFQRIAQRQLRFISRGDNSGTHMRERSLWSELAVSTDWDQYVESGQGMGPTLIMADQMQAYVLSDFGTYLNFRDKLDLVPLVRDEVRLRNPYSVIVVDTGAGHENRQRLANALADYLISDEGQGRIQDYRIDGQPLFYPTRLGADQ